MHEIGADEPCEGEGSVDDFDGVLGEFEQEIGDQGDGDLDGHGIFGAADEMPDAQRRLDPAEEQLDRPAALVERGDLGGRRVEIVREEARRQEADAIIGQGRALRQGPVLD